MCASISPHPLLVLSGYVEIIGKQADDVYSKIDKKEKKRNSVLSVMPLHLNRCIF